MGGSWRMSFGRVTQEGDVIYAWGAESGVTLQLALDSRCTYDLEASATSNLIRGTYLTRSCTRYALGTLELQKQP